jgi:ferredoxin-type protein NapH
MAVTPVELLGKEAVARKGWLRAHKWLLLRRLSQLSIIALFLLGPLYGIWIIKGNLNSSLILDTVPLSDPYILLQTLASGYLPETTALLGAAIVIVFYLLVSGRTYCAWVCPINMVTDLSMWLRNRFNIKSSVSLSRATRYWILAVTLVLPALTGIIAWEYVNPVSMTNRALVFGIGYAWVMVLMIFLFDTFVSRRAWCGHLCPMGAFYSLLGRFSPLRVNAIAVEKCDDCMECYAVCPEKKIIKPVLLKTGRETSLISDINCTRCGRCIDICSTEVFRFDLVSRDVVSNRAQHSRQAEIPSNQPHQKEVLP